MQQRLQEQPDRKLRLTVSCPRENYVTSIRPWTVNEAYNIIQTNCKSVSMKSAV